MSQPQQIQIPSILTIPAMIEDKMTLVRYISDLQIQKLQPDANTFYRFKTTFLTLIAAEQIQTSDGVIMLGEPYGGPKLTHNDCIIVLARCVMKGRFQGSVKRVQRLAGIAFQELCRVRLGEQMEEVQAPVINDHF